MVKIVKKIVRPIARPIREAYRDARAFCFINKTIKKDRTKSKDLPIYVGFVAQMPEIWDKQMDLFEYLLTDDRFEPYIIFINHFNHARQKIEAGDNKEKSFYETLYGKNRIIEYANTPEASLSKFDYVFYDRPYNQCVPKTICSSNAVKMTKVCMINYSTRDWDGSFGYKEFARNVYMWFASSTLEYKLHEKEYSKKRYNKVFDVGYPAYEHYRNLETQEFNKSVLWTPRWSYDQDVGGSHFFEYIDKFIEFIKNHPDVKLIIRPHPLMFENFIAKRLITENEMKRIISRCESVGIVFDDNRIIADTFRKTDILVSDYSSIVGLFMASGKPIVYCPMNIPINESYRSLTEAMYVSRTWDEIEKNLVRLLEQNDEMKVKRNEKISTVLITKENAVGSIAEILWSDFTDV